MLRRLLAGSAVLLIGSGSLVVTFTEPSWAEECAAGEIYDSRQERCIEVSVEDPGENPDDDSGDGGTVPVGDMTCVTKPYGGQEPFEVPCYDEVHGYWSNADSCYWKKADPQPPASDEVWEGNFPEGAIYEPYCLPRINQGQNNCFEVGGPANACQEWRATPPWEVPDPGELARRALQEMHLTGPDIGLAPPAGTKGLVELPVWMWNNVNARTWTSTSEPACDAGLCVTVTATAESITWDMGNGDTVECDEGTPYQEDSESSCSYTYQRASTDQPGGMYQITATTHWTVTWQANNGLTGELEPFDLSTQAELAIASAGPLLVE